MIDRSLKLRDRIERFYLDHQNEMYSSSKKRATSSAADQASLLRNDKLESNDYRIIWHISPPYVARARQMPSLRGGAYSKGIYYGRWSVRHTNFAATLSQGGAYMPGGLIAKGGLICQIIR
jgi:hypothetical protein